MKTFLALGPVRAQGHVCLFSATLFTALRLKAKEAAGTASEDSEISCSSYDSARAMYSNPGSGEQELIKY